MVCGLLYGMLAVEWYVGCCRSCGLLYGIGLLYCMWAVEWYVGCCMICELLNSIWALVA